ncbi:MAG: FAD-dependent oxidoreductase [Planctomycetaceae bacterium]|nr:FAD-dependent oxidoreductase [Planctomycetaceae bacterium]
MKVVIIGGVAGGASAAARLRRLSEEAEIVVVERGPDVSFANCGLPYFIGETITERSHLLVVTPQLLRTRFRLDVRVRSEAASIDRSAKTIQIRDLETDTVVTESYDKLILAPGASPIRPPFPGVDLPEIHTLRNLQDMDRIKAAADEGARHAVIVGAGFIGLELAENLVHRGVNTTIVELQEQVLGPFDSEMTTPLADVLTQHGVQLVLGDSVEGFSPAPEGVEVRLKSGRKLPAQLVTLSIGVRPESGLAVAAGLDIGPLGGIRVNASMQTSDPDIYAVGDAVEVTDVVLGGVTRIPLAGPANRQGRLAADHICGRDVGYRGSQGTAVLGLFGRTAAMTGATEKALRRTGREYRKVYVHPNDHAGYYPGAEMMTLKLLFDPHSGRILGAQGVGGAGVDKRIDVLATAIQAGMTVYDLEEMELCYAPQFGSAKDAVNMLGFVAAGLLRGDHPQIDVDELTPLPAEDRPFVLDVRSPTEFSHGAIPDAVNIPIDELRSRLDELPRDREIAAYCFVGQRGYLATRILLQSGFRARNISGGYRTWRLWNRPEA